MRKKTQFYSWALSGLFIIILIYSCSSDKDTKLWDETVLANNLNAYENYLDNFPEGKFNVAASDSLQELLFRQAENSNAVLPIYDRYHENFPNGKYNNQFESLVYDEAILKNTQPAFEEYISRFPNGMHINEFEGILFDAIVKRESTMTFEDYLIRYPETDSIAVIEKALYDSVIILRTPESVEMYIKLFPEGSYLLQVNSELEKIYHKRAVKLNHDSAFNEFMQKFPKSDLIKKLHITSKPDNSKVIITDVHNNTIKQLTAPETVLVIEGTSLYFACSKEEFHPDTLLYIVSQNEFQNFNFKLKTIANYLIYDKFDKSLSPFVISGKKYTFELQENDKLLCNTKEKQFQNDLKVDIDFKKDFTIAIKFKFENELPRGKNYIGITWGSEASGRYFFATIDGRLSFGEKESRYHSPENVLGYSKWNAYSGIEDTWSQASSFKANKYNILLVEKIGNSITYKLNGITFHKENIFNVPAGSNVGFGIGNTEVLLDYFMIIQ